VSQRTVQVGLGSAFTDTPLMQQYREIKARYPHTILFFRMGDFYEMFEDDARLAARELGITLTSRNNGGAAEVPLAGVPVKAATDYLRQLIAKGHRVAICEQVEDPKLAKSGAPVRREVVETVTPGTVLSDDWLERNRNNYVVALEPRGPTAGIAALDVTTGELILEVVPTDDVPAVLARYEAPELVVPGGQAPPAHRGGVGGEGGGATITERDPPPPRPPRSRSARRGSSIPSSRARTSPARSASPPSTGSASPRATRPRWAPPARCCATPAS
jgi:DNA mismatch repair protein MutS